MDLTIHLESDHKTEGWDGHIFQGPKLVELKYSRQRGAKKVQHQESDHEMGDSDEELVTEIVPTPPSTQDLNPLLEVMSEKKCRGCDFDKFSIRGHLAKTTKGCKNRGVEGTKRKCC